MEYPKSRISKSLLSAYSELNTKAQQNGKTLIEQIMADNFETYTGFNQ